MKAAELWIIPLALGASVIITTSIHRYAELPALARAQAEQAKAELLAAPGMMDAHNSAYGKAGERRWELEIKPTVLMRLTTRTAQDTGNPVPRWEQVVEWVRNHPEEAKELMENRDQGFPSSAR